MEKKISVETRFFKKGVIGPAGMRKRGGGLWEVIKRKGETKRERKSNCKQAKAPTSISYYQSYSLTPSSSNFQINTL